LHFPAQQMNAKKALKLSKRSASSPARQLRTLERLYRDSRCGSVMVPWTAETCLERVGRESLYEPEETDE
jgi:hypothetical protein